MSIPFSQTTRALQADQNRFTLLGMGFAILLFLLWTKWFFTAEINHYVSNSDSVEITREPQPVWNIPEGGNRVTAYHRYHLQASFHPKDLARITIGQKVKIQLKNSDTMPKLALKAKVTKTRTDTNQLFAYIDIPEDKPNPFSQAEAKQLKVSVVQQSPAAHFMFQTVVPKP